MFQYNFDKIEGSRGELNFSLRYCFDKNALVVSNLSKVLLKITFKNVK